LEYFGSDIVWEHVDASGRSPPERGIIVKGGFMFLSPPRGREVKEVTKYG
jgi:hypothetical protein